MTDRAAIAGAEPVLFVTDIKRACDFFTMKLGFSLAFTWGEPPFYAQVRRDTAHLNLRHVDRPVIDPHVRDREQLPAAALNVATADDIKALFREFQATGVAFFQLLKTEPWGAQTFIVGDPDGNLLVFAGPAH